MRRCIHCDVEMVEILDVKLNNRIFGISVEEPDLFKKTFWENLLCSMSQMRIRGNVLKECFIFRKTSYETKEERISVHPKII